LFIVLFCSAAMTMSNSDTKLVDWISDIIDLGPGALMERIIREERELIKPDSQSSKHFSLLENQPKNRYRDIPCLDHSRVLLRGSPSDYIHANWVTVPELGVRVILSQAPKDNTLSDFWDVILQENITLMVNLTKAQEIEIGKCLKYYPEVHKSLKCQGVQNIVVICVKVRKMAFFNKIKLVLYCKNSGQRRKVYLFTYNEWPDHEVPSCDQFVQFVLYMIKCMKKMNNEQHMLIHCSAGVGRSGTLIASIRLLLQLQAGERPNVFQMVNSIRQERARAVQGLNQYKLLYCVILHYYTLLKHAPSDKVAAVKQLIASLLPNEQNVHYAHRRMSELRKENSPRLDSSGTAMEKSAVSKLDQTAALSLIAEEKEAENVVRPLSSVALTATEQPVGSPNLKGAAKCTSSKGFLDKRKVFAKQTASPKQTKSADKNKPTEKVDASKNVGALKPQKSGQSGKTKKSSNKLPELIACGNQCPSEAWSLLGDKVVGFIESVIDQAESDEELSRLLLLIAYYLPVSEQRWSMHRSRLSDSIERISDEAFLCLVHAFMLRRSIPNSIFPILDLQIRRRLDRFTFDDLGLISLAYFKCCRRFQYGHVGRYLAVRLENHLATVDEVQNVPVAAVLKQLRYVQQGDLSNLLPSILRRFAELPSVSLKLVTWIHAAYFATRLCLFDEKFTKSLFEKVRANKGEIRAKDASVLLHYLALFDYSADGMDQFLVNVFETEPIAIKSVIKFPETLTSALRSAVIRGLYPMELIDNCFSSKFISRFANRHYFPFLDYYFIDCSVAIEKSDSGLRLDFKHLPNSFKYKSRDMYTVVDDDSIYKKIHCHIADAVGKRLRCSTAAVQFCRILPHFFAFDTVIRFRDGDFDMTQLQYEIKAYNREELLVPADEIRIVLFAEHNNRCRLHTHVPLGHVQARKRQAIQLGYKVIELNGYKIARRPLNDVETAQLVNVIQQFCNSKAKASSIVRAF
ncbi:Tyrosine-protein phosphatase non-receptor type 2, partial [Trichinella pseudospiralis]